MKCSYCAAVLPSDALFCGECGRGVTKPSSRTVLSAPLPDQGPIPSSPPLTAPLPQPELWMNASASSVCEQCGSVVGPDDIFCGECGFVVARPEQPKPEPADTNLMERLEQVLEPELTEEPDLHEDVEATRIVAHPRMGERYVLQFSTGESFTVFGSGLIGRSPRPEPGEYFDQLVRIVDANRSVSKTHLEFGQESGSFWVKDRFSGNGTVVREPETNPVRCHPDRRYPLVRGSRVDIGEQFFVVS